MTSIFFAIVLFFVTADGTRYQAVAPSGNFDSYEACVAMLEDATAVLTEAERANFAGAACVERDLGNRLAEALPG